jgi:uncharacterized protein (DUF1330 family)
VAKREGSVSAYFVLQIDWTDQAARKKYVEGITGMIENHGGRFLVSSEDLRTLEGRWDKSRLVVIEFPSKEALLGWYESPEYRPMLDLRLSSSTSNAVMTGGV